MSRRLIQSKSDASPKDQVEGVYRRPVSISNVRIIHIYDGRHRSLTQGYKNERLLNNGRARGNIVFPLRDNKTQVGNLKSKRSRFSLFF